MRCAKSMSCKERRCQRTTELQTKTLRLTFLTLLLYFMNLTGLKHMGQPDNM